MENRTRQALTAMRRILRTTELNARIVLRQTGLTPSQLILLQMLEFGDEQTAGKLAARMGVTQATLTTLVHKLEAMGMLQRRKGDTDRRQVWLSITDKAREVLMIAPDGVHSQFNAEFLKLADWEQAMIVASLERVAAMLDTQHQAAIEGLEGPDLLLPVEPGLDVEPK